MKKLGIILCILAALSLPAAAQQNSAKANGKKVKELNTLPDASYYGGVIKEDWIKPIKNATQTYLQKKSAANLVLSINPSNQKYASFLTLSIHKQEQERAHTLNALADWALQNGKQPQAVQKRYKMLQELMDKNSLFAAAWSLHLPQENIKDYINPLSDKDFDTLKQLLGPVVSVMPHPRPAKALLTDDTVLDVYYNTQNGKKMQVQFNLAERTVEVIVR